MQLRIVVSLEGSKTVVKVDGRLDAEGVPELEKVTRDKNAVLCLDLSGLRLADGEGIAALLRLQQAGAMIQGASPYLKLLLEEALPVSKAASRP
jgi:anti-anti-sigma regulatory factor